MSDYVINFNSLSYQEYPPVFIVIERYNQSLSAAENYRPEEGFLLECLDSLFNIKQLDCYYTALIKGKRDKIDELKEEVERRRRQEEAGKPEGGVKYEVNIAKITKSLIERMSEEDLAKYYQKHEREIDAEEEEINHPGKNKFLNGGWYHWFQHELLLKRPSLVILLGDEAKVTSQVYCRNFYKTEAKDTILQEILCWYYNDWEPFKTLYLDDNTLEDRDLLLQRLMEAKPEIDVALAQPRPWKEISIIPKTPERRVNYADIEGDTGKVYFYVRESKAPKKKKEYVKQPESEPDDLGHYHIAGFQHYQGGEVAEQLEAGTELTLKAEPENEYDPSAVAIYFGDKKLGYIPKGKNEELSKLLRYGREDLFEVKSNYKDLERHPERQFGIAVKIRKMPPNP